MIIEPNAVVQFHKHLEPEIVTPEQNQNEDSYTFIYRIFCFSKVLEDKVNGVYVHSKS